MRAEMLNFGERHKLFTSSWQDMVVTYQTFSERTNTFLSKAIDDCFETAKKHQSIHSEHTSIQEKVVQLEAKATQDHQKVLFSSFLFFSFLFFFFFSSIKTNEQSTTKSLKRSLMKQKHMLMKLLNVISLPVNNSLQKLRSFMNSKFHN